MAFNMDPKKCPMPTQDPNVRNKNFEEVALGYTEEMAVNEAKRCIHCKNKPCQTGCPVGIDIPEFIGHVAEGDFEAAYQVIARSSSLPAVCGRVCPQESQCEGKCTRGIKNEPVGIAPNRARFRIYPKDVLLDGILSILRLIRMRCFVRNAAADPRKAAMR